MAEGLHSPVVPGLRALGDVAGVENLAVFYSIDIDSDLEATDRSPLEATACITMKAIMVEFHFQCGVKFDFMPFLCGVQVPGWRD